jgi:hypothetical protein
MHHPVGHNLASASEVVHEDHHEHHKPAQRVNGRDAHRLSGRRAFAGWEPSAFRNIFLALEVLLLSLVIISFFKHKLGVKRSVVVIVMALVCYIASAALGVFVVERFVFPEQFKITFG